MEYILLASIITGTIVNFFISKYFSQKISSNQSKLLENYRKELLTFSITQKPNSVTESDPDEIQFTEENFMNLPKDVKFEVEGGDSSIPPGYSQKAGEA